MSQDQAPEYSLPQTTQPNPDNSDPAHGELQRRDTSSYPLAETEQREVVVPDQIPNSLSWQSTPDQQRAPLRRRRPTLVPSIAPPLKPGQPDDSANRIAADAYYNPPDQVGLPNEASILPGTAWPLPPPSFRPDLGHRSPEPLTREIQAVDYGQKFEHEKKHKEYPGLAEILATGRYFGSATVQYIRPSFQANTSVFLNQSGITETFDFAYKLSPKLQLGFESKFGPGIEFEYWGYDDLSRVASFSSDGIQTATTSAWMRGANQWSRLSADNAGETLTARHRMDIDVLGACFFKEVKLPISRINGKFGFQAAHIIHELNAQVTDSGGNALGILRNRSDVRGYGPQFNVEYFRPVGHTKIEFLTCAGGSVLFGKQSQAILNSTGMSQSRLRADEFMLAFEFFTGAQYRLMFGENRYYFVRGGMLYQAWLHGGTAVLPQDDFGLRGFSLTVGINR
jgi:hypothetical protein